MNTLLIFVLVVLQLHSVNARRLKVRPLQLTSAAFEGIDGGYSFDVSENLRYCNSRVDYVPPGLEDYSAIFDVKLRALAEKGGGTLLLGPGVYPHSKQIELPSFTCLRGAGMLRTVLKLTDNAPSFTRAGSIRTFETTRVTISDLTQDGNRHMQRKGEHLNYGRYGVYSELSNYFYIKSVKVQNNGGYGFDPHGSKKEWASYLVIDDCVAEHNGYDGFTIDQTVYASVFNCYAAGNARHGFNVVTGTRHAHLKHCIARDNGVESKVGFGFVAQNNGNFGTKSIIFSKCTATTNFKGGFKLSGVSDIIIRNSDVYGTGKSVCYEMANTTNVVLNGNGCSVLPSRKFNLGPGANYKEYQDRSSFRIKPTRKKHSATAQSKVVAIPIPTNPDPMCNTGIQKSGACCPRRCGICGGVGCGSRGPDGMCCVKVIRRVHKSCSIQGPPCLLSH